MGLWWFWDGSAVGLWRVLAGGHREGAKKRRERKRRRSTDYTNFTDLRERGRGGGGEGGRVEAAERGREHGSLLLLLADGGASGVGWGVIIPDLTGDVKGLRKKNVWIFWWAWRAIAGWAGREKLGE